MLFRDQIYLVLGTILQLQHAQRFHVQGQNSLEIHTVNDPSFKRTSHDVKLFILSTCENMRINQH